METTTARIDMQKLAILNDRITQTLDALQQVRISAHNIGVQNQFGWQTPFYGAAFSGLNNHFGYPVQQQTSFGLNPTLPADPRVAYGYTPSFYGQPSFFGQPAINPLWNGPVTFTGPVDERFRFGQAPFAANSAPVGY